MNKFDQYLPISMALLLALTASYLFVRDEPSDYLSGLFMCAVSLAWFKMRAPRES
jgi:hypothetical protein